MYVLTESQAFRLHLDTLAKAKHLHLPDINKLHAYKAFTQAHQLPFVEDRKKPKSEQTTWTRTCTAAQALKAAGIHVGENQKAEFVKIVTEDKDHRKVESGEAENEDNEISRARSGEAETEDDEIGEAELQVEPQEDLATVFRRRIGMHVTHFGATMLVVNFCTRRADRSTTFEVPLMVPHVANERPGRHITWEGIGNVLRQLCMDPQLMKKAIELIEFAVEHLPVSEPLVSTFRKLLWQHNKVAVHGKKHCEVVLATILKYREAMFRGWADDKLFGLIQVCSFLMYC